MQVCHLSCKKHVVWINGYYYFLDFFFELFGNITLMCTVLLSSGMMYSLLTEVKLSVHIFTTLLTLVFSFHRLMI
jgi:hypothetical protein